MPFPLSSSPGFSPTSHKQNWNLVLPWALHYSWCLPEPWDPPAPPNFLLPWLTLAHSSDWAQPSEFSRTSRLRVQSVPQRHSQYLLDLVRDVESQAPPQTHWVRSAFIKDSRRIVCIVIFRSTALGILVHSLHHPPTVGESGSHALLEAFLRGPWYLFISLCFLPWFWPLWGPGWHLIHFWWLTQWLV